MEEGSSRKQCAAIKSNHLFEILHDNQLYHTQMAFLKDCFIFLIMGMSEYLCV